MLPPEVLAAIADAVRRAETVLLDAVRQNRADQEPDLTSRLVQSIELSSSTIDGVVVEFTVVDAMGPGAAENTLGADVLGVLRVETGGLRVAKGFLAQAKRSGSEGVHFRVGDAKHPEDSADYGHWLWRAGLHLDASGTVEISRPSERLLEQCDRMLQASADSFVLVFARRQVAVVSASAVKALGFKPPRTRTRTALGTKRLDDFFVHLADCFIGDPQFAAADRATVTSLAASLQARSAMLLTVIDTRQ